MTRNQISYQNMLIESKKAEETARANLARETETHRSNLAVEAETQAHNKSQDTIAAVKLGADYLGAIGKLIGAGSEAVGSILKVAALF